MRQESFILISLKVSLQLRLWGSKSSSNWEKRELINWIKSLQKKAKNILSRTETLSISKSKLKDDLISGFFIFIFIFVLFDGLLILIYFEILL